MSEVTQTDLLVAKMMALEVMLLTLVRPAAGNPKFWEEAEKIVKVMENHTPEMSELVERRWTATRGYINEWRMALTPPA